MTPQSQKKIERKEEEESYTKTHSDRRCQLRKDMAQNICDLTKVKKKRVK